MKQKLGEIIAQKTRDEWDAILAATDVCYAPVLDMVEAAQHPHNVARETITQAFGVTQPNVAPRFSRTQSEIQGPPPEIGAHTEDVMQEWGIADTDISALRDSGAI